MSANVPVPLFTPPGACKYNCDSCRPLIGRPATSRALTLALILADAVFTTVSSPETTSTLTATPFTERTRSSVTVWPTSRSTEVGFVSSSCDVAAVTEYFPGLSATIENVPSSRLVTVRDSPVCALTTVTTAPGTTTPWASLKDPLTRASD